MGTSYVLVEVKIHAISLVRVAMLQYLSKSKGQISFDQRILLRRVSSAGNTYKCTKDACIGIFNVALFVIARLKTTKDPLIEVWIYKF